MSVFLRAPYPSVQTTTTLPNPLLGDSEGATVEVATRRTLDGTLFTYVKTKHDRRRLHLNFRVTRTKGLEVYEFIRSYHASPMLYYDHLDRIWLGYIMNNPFEFVTDSTWKSERYPHGEMMTFTLEFEGILQ